MTQPKDIEIAQQTKLRKISEIAETAGLTEDEIEPYGRYKGKIDLPLTGKRQSGKLVLVTSINPTPAGEGKTTVTIGLGDGLRKIGKRAVLALREPSLGPVMGMKGGATGGGYAQVAPMEDINLHFNGDFHALTTANNTLAALIDNHIQQGNELHIDPRRISFHRVLDINDRALRNTVIGMGGPTSGMPREDHFDITVASELMAILCLATDLHDLKTRINRIVVAENYDRQPVTVADLQVGGAIALLLKEAIKPNLVQTLEGTPAIIHGGPFANIAHGCNSVLATRTALQLGEYAVTEAGFGADLGAEKFLDIKVPVLGKTPDAVVLVATVRALKLHGGQALADLTTPNLDALQKGLANLGKHIESMQRYQVPVVVAINAFTSDTSEEIKLIQDYCQQFNVEAVEADEWAHGGDGTTELAHAVVRAAQQPTDFKPLYDADDDIVTKATKIVTTIYGGRGVVLEPHAKVQLRRYAKRGWDKLPVCMAKTQYSLTDRPKQLGAPKDFDIHIRAFEPRLGAGFMVALTGSILTMPGLPKHPAALDMAITDDGKISGIF
ncbi:MAG: formate--tetrahydrofolate ligase [Furfurilactobacillus sp.]|jgi:formate--tetrahydrofolate ligase|uniref:formate--tetrahydrofolate ligase n=1 Tax=Furfurilactobacillus sp. TaxID=2767911 RepID=UPI00258F5DB1|nr:formate--tetrahydrofolate ligase [Furfurilactobacillus sp.]MCH4010696.1 formate--tetrahydrofolate ligase [Furfurilactobacillus sp.]MCH4036588.1 formate--tetrahydrofolate ligase [Furfurilactobacillus sp.]MCH4114466.1 formate--tetrahydrofolate ligase [Furfurilactobacillus sp.]MCH4132711.1 formate--tetrahydrofolate ligase [Furfurilactobacillus sp.]MCI1340709.1 formate--tetrahydrofolate ligase [Furfurilactobacillus sp.]